MNPTAQPKNYTHMKVLLKNPLVILAVLFLGASFHAAAFDMRFEICTFCCPCQTTNHMCTNQFNALNTPTNSSNPVGHMIMMGSDEHRSQVNGNGNFLGAYYDTLNADYPSMTGAQAADDIQNNYLIPNFTQTGAMTKWVCLNELSAGLWPSDSTYRKWVHDLCARLKNTYNHTVIVFSPFPNPGANGSDWTNLSSVAYIVVENYLSGALVNSHANSVSWCQSQYQSSVNSYTSLGVPASQLMFAEHFGQTLSGVNWGRGGCSAAGWTNAINARAQAIYNIAPPGFVSYGWNNNDMDISDTDLISYEETYEDNPLP
jgi:hypothetical protein